MLQGPAASCGGAPQSGHLSLQAPPRLAHIREQADFRHRRGEERCVHHGHQEPESAAVEPVQVGHGAGGEGAGHTARKVQHRQVRLD